MKLNTSKCKVVTIAASKTTIEHKYGFKTDNSVFVELEQVKNMKDLGVTFTNDFSFKDHVYEKSNKAYQMIGIINRNFRELDRGSFLLIYKSLVRSHLEYANSVWNPHLKYLIEDIEKFKKGPQKWLQGFLSCPTKRGYYA